MNKSLFIFAFFVFSTVFAFGQSRSTVRVAADSTVEGAIVKLGGIARIEGEAGNIEKLKSISLGYAPNVGMTRELTYSQIRLALAAAGFAESEIALDAPPRVTIRRAGQIVSEIQFRAAVEGFLTEKFAAERVEARIVRLDTPENISTPAGAIEIRPNFSAIQNFFEPFSLPIEIRVDGKVYRRLSANIEIEALAEILVAEKDLPVNQEIFSSDVRLEKRRISKPLANYVREAGALRGLKTLKTIAGGETILRESLAASVVVIAGDAVRVEAQSGKLVIIVNGEARASGRIGDRIAVKNLQSGAIMQATVVDRGVVRILF